MIDAWYGSYGDPISVALMRRDDNVARVVAETVFADDDRQQVGNTQDFPWVCLCWLVITAESGHRFIGTGWLASARTVITAGHCVYMHNEGGWAQQVQVYPGGTGGPYVSDDLYTTDTYVASSANYADDYGAIVLPVALPNYLGVEAPEASDLSNMQVNVSGYPSDKPEGTLWGSTRRLVRATSRQLYYDISTAGGQSGCPVLYQDAEGWWGVGIHNYGGVRTNMATRITSAVYDQIEQWKK
jgi:V8-like Glu-specific endopeptidase